MEYFNEEQHSGHRNRMRQRMDREGVDDFAPHELLEFILSFAISRQNVNDLAHALLEYFGSMEAIFESSHETLLEVEGIGETAANWIFSLGKLSASCGAARPEERIFLTNYGDMKNFALRTARDYGRPCCVQLLIDHYGLLVYRNIFGEIPARGRCRVPSQPIREAIALNANSAALVICAGKRVSYPSNYDREFAREYAEAINSAGVSLMDVMVCGSTGVISMRRLNMLPEDSPRIRRSALHEEYISSIPVPVFRPVRPARLSPRSYRSYSPSGGIYERTEPV